MYHKAPADQVQIDFHLVELNVLFLRITAVVFLVILDPSGFVPSALSQGPTGSPSQKTNSDESIQRISNGQISVGIKPASGGAIAWVASEPGGQNMVDAHDRGRLVQQSYYGKSDGSLWNKQPWRWNPVQGGDWRGNSARVLELSLKDSSAYIKTLPKHWASGEDLTTTTMQQWIELDGPVAHIRYQFQQRGGEDHPPTHQELPAVFLRPDLRNLVMYDGRNHGPMAN